MSIRKNWRTTLLVLLITVTFTSVIGGTMAWFTDTVTSSTNVIEAGTLDVALNFADAKNYNGASTVWADVEGKNVGPIFNYNLWEPGYTSLKYLQVVNNGSLAFKYQIQVVPSTSIVEGQTNLADVIDVYYTIVDDNFTPPTSASAVLSWSKLGTITDLMNQPETTVTGVMLGGQQPMTIAIALHMQEEAGNEYQGLSVGDGFAIKLVATQYTKENDSFDNLYDLGAGFVTTDYPKAGVKRLDTSSAMFTTVNTNREENLDVGYVFTAQEPDIDNSPYKEWHADFVISFDKPMKANVVGLAGQYEDFSLEWFGFDIDADIIHAVADDADVLPANTPVRMLATAGINFSYEMICDIVKVFNCGTYAITDEANGVTATVELRLYEPADDFTNTDNESETGKYITVGKFTYTYEYQGE